MSTNAGRSGPTQIGNDVKISSSGSSVATTDNMLTTFSTGTNSAVRVLISVDGDAYVKIGSSPTASASDNGGFYLSSGSGIDVFVKGTDKIAMIRKGGSGTVICSIAHLL